MDRLIRTTLDAIDTFVADLQRGVDGPATERTALVVDVGRAAATGTVDLDSMVADIDWISSS
ncbi:MAG: hypothetical protein ACR2GO_02035 [Candidatus Limnocylindria bacterium]